MSGYLIRTAREVDLPEVVRLLADDELGQSREAVVDPLPDEYLRAFHEIDRDERNMLIVIEDNGQIIGTVQLTFIPGLTHQGGERAQIEGVRVAVSHRNQGVGRLMFEWAIERARERRCRIVQLTTGKRRPDAHRFYGSLGFIPSHEGMKLRL